MPIRQPISKSDLKILPLCFLGLGVALAVSWALQRDIEPNWNIAPAAQLPVPNGHDFFVRAAKNTVRFKPEIDSASDTTFNLPNSAYALKNYSLARRKKWLLANKKTFQLVNQGLKTPSMAPDDNQNWGRLRQLARDMSAKTRTLQMDGNSFAATLNVLDTMQMGQDATRGGNALPRLVGVAIMAIGRDPLEDWNVTVNKLSAAEALQAAKRLEKLIANEPSATQTLIAEKRAVLLEVKRVFATKNWRHDFISSDASVSPTYFWQTRTVSRRTIHNNLNRVLDSNIARADLPYSKAQIPAPPLANLDVLTEIIAPSYQRFHQNEARQRTSNQMLMLRLALRAYIAKNGRAPAKLSLLTPNFLQKIPADVYNDEKPLNYFAKAKTYKLWSVGPDGINDNGAPLSRRSSAKSNRPAQNLLDNTGDFVAGLCK